MNNYTQKNNPLQQYLTNRANTPDLPGKKDIIDEFSNLTTKELNALLALFRDENYLVFEKVLNNLSEIVGGKVWNIAKHGNTFELGLLYGKATMIEYLRRHAKDIVKETLEAKAGITKKSDKD